MSTKEIVLKPKVEKFLQGVKGLYINGEYVQSKNGKTFDVLNPATEEVLAEASEAQETDIDVAVEAAKEAFEEGEWTKMEAAERSLAQLEALDNGKPYEVALEDDIDGTIEHFRYYAGWATKITGKTVNVSPDYFNYIVHEPVGVVGQI